MARRRQIVPECGNALNQMKLEIAAELGVPFSANNFAGMDTEFAGELGSMAASGPGQQYLGNLTSRETGAVGGEITKRLIRQAQQTVL